MPPVKIAPRGSGLPVPAMRRPRPVREPWQRPYFNPHGRTLSKKPFVGSGPYRIITAADGGPVRNVITYASACSTFATFSGKAARQQYCEGATEMAALREAEMRTEYLDLQFQPLRIEWLQPGGGWRRYTFDSAFELEDGTLVFEELKAASTQFSKSAVHEKLEAARKVMANYGVQVRRRDASCLQNSPVHEAITSLWALRRTTIEDHHTDRVLETIGAAGGEIPLGRLLECIDDNVNFALGIAAALTMRRTMHIAFDQGPLQECAVTIPPMATRGRLRSFLAMFVGEM